MMTALIKMGQIEKGCVTMELYNDLPAGLCAHTGLSPRQIERREEGGAKERKGRRREERRRDERGWRAKVRTDDKGGQI